ncbi:MAG: hypothetical protein ACM3N5_05070 [Candidatus Eiseniibacteriota bacterium]
MMKPVILTAAAFLLAGIVGVCGLYLTDDIDIAIGAFVAVIVLQVLVIWNWQDRGPDGPGR